MRPALALAVVAAPRLPRAQGGRARRRPQFRVVGRERPARGRRPGVHGGCCLRLADWLPPPGHEGPGRGAARSGDGAPAQDGARVAGPRERRPAGPGPGRHDAGPHVLARPLPRGARPAVPAARAAGALRGGGAAGTPALLPAGASAALSPGVSAAKPSGPWPPRGRRARHGAYARRAVGVLSPAGAGGRGGGGRATALHAGVRGSVRGRLHEVPPDAAGARGLGAGGGGRALAVGALPAQRPVHGRAHEHASAIGA
mmetsp:Transcript_133786/g.416115  ORF Transcript_133786/g.416115 Transcript_133786/m.416115 type:complete len:257 (-) Transcript_133786:874-1644(-)